MGEGNGPVDQDGSKRYRKLGEGGRMGEPVNLIGEAVYMYTYISR